MGVVSGLRTRPAEHQRRRDSQLLITDVDNTLYDFGRYFEAGLARMVPYVGTGLRLKESEVLAQLRSVYTARGSIEYPFAVEEFEEAVGLSRLERRTVAQGSASAFWEGASEALVPYAGVV